MGTTSDERVMTGEVAVAVHDEQLLAVFDRALAEVYGYLLHRCRAKALAEDLASETYLGALDSIRRGYAGEVTVAWLIGIARHKLADHWRREEREQRHLAAVAAEPAGPDLAVEVEPDLGIEVLGLLSPSHRAALTLRHVDGLSVQEVADLLGRSLHSTETLLVRARAAFRTKYREAEEAGR
ncbi:MAG TPA: RNA polymerase sigma factor [Ornithinibacter sp.]|nr:RNA polymerase sigma factor [Ornithinibacter sp.]